MNISRELFAKLNTLPWQALYEYAKLKGIKEELLKNKDKTQIIKELESKDLIKEKEIDKLIEEYIYGNRVTFSLWRLDKEISESQINVIKQLEGKQIRCECNEFRNVKIQKVTQYGDRLELIYVYSKLYNYINELGRSDQVWEQHKGCSWIGTDKNYVAYIVKHEKMTRIFATDLINEIHIGLNPIKPPLTALTKIFNNSVMSKIVLQGLDGEKTAISRSRGFTDRQKQEVKRVKEDRFNTSGSYITSIYNDKTATVRYNIKKGNMSILKHISSKELFAWTEGAIEIIFQEIDNLKGKDVKIIFNELGLDLKWSLLSSVEEEQMNWILTRIIDSLNKEQTYEIPSDKTHILEKDMLFTKILRPYCEQCESYEIPLCQECGKQLDSGENMYCSCGAPIVGVCNEGHKIFLNKYWYIPTKVCIDMLNENLKRIQPSSQFDYSFCIMENIMLVSNSNKELGGEIIFSEIEEFKSQEIDIENAIVKFAVNMKEKCEGTCSYEKIERCLKDKKQICLPKLFYNIIPGFIPQPHKGTEYGDVSGRIKANGIEYEMKGIIKKNSSKKEDKQNTILLSTSSNGQEIIRQFVEQGMSDQRCSLIMIVVPQKIDNSFKGTLKFLARLANKKVVFVELDGVCKLLKKSEII